MTRFATWPQWAARLLFVALGVLILYAAVPRPAPAHIPTEAFDDKALYLAITKRVMAGEHYYRAAQAEHRAHAYPLAPAQVFREPTLTWWLALLRSDGLRAAALIGLAVAVVLAARGRLEAIGLTPAHRIIVVAGVACGLAMVGVPRVYLLHETWAVTLIALALAIYRPQRWPLSAALVVLACLFRELAAPVLGVMALFALLERRPGEAAGWAAGFAAFTVCYLVHLHVAGGLASPGDITSASWLGLGGVPFVIETARRVVGLDIAPPAVVAAAAAAGLIGLAGARHPIAARCALIVGGYMCAFLVLGRANNSYWGLLYAPLLPLGLVLAPAALRDLWRAAWTPERAAAAAGT